MKPTIRRNDIIEPDLSYKTMGVLFDVYNSAGAGYSEIYYHRAIAIGLVKAGIKFEKEVYLPVEFKAELIGRQRCDFLIENKIILEIKKNNKFSKQNIDQVFNYLKASGLKLAIIVNITPSGIIYKRIINSYVRTDS